MKLHELMRVQYKLEKELDVDLVVDLAKQVAKDTKDKMLEVVEELDLDLKEDNFHYLGVYLKEDSIITNLEPSMQ